MIYSRPDPTARIDQGDVIRGCPILTFAGIDHSAGGSPQTRVVPERVVVLTQTCDLAQQRVTRAVVAVAYPADDLVRASRLKATDIRGPIRAARVFAWYFLPSHADAGLPESVVDLRYVHTVPLDLLNELCRRGQREARIQPLYREHLAKHFADTYSRIGLPEPYPTET